MATESEEEVEVLDVVSPKFEDEVEVLDFMSPKFNPLKALYSKNVRLPIPNAPVLDNIHKYRSALNRPAKKQSAQVCC
jgi:hypothetical protein